MMKLALLLVLPFFAQDNMRGSWDGQVHNDDRIYINLNVRTNHGMGYSNYGRTFQRSELSDVVRANGDISFRLTREAGVIVFKGKEDGDQMGGTWTFTPSANYRQQLEKLGYREAMDEDMFVFSVSNLTIADVKYLEDATSDRLTIEQMVRMCNHAATADFVRSLASAGYSNLSSDEIVRARDHGVSPEYVAGMKGLGFKLALEDLVRTRDHGVTPEFVREFAGYDDMTAAGFVRLRDHGVTGRFMQDVRELGYKDVDPEDLVRLRDHGVTPSYIRKVNDEYGRKVDLDRIVQLRDRGF